MITTGGETTTAAVGGGGTVTEAEALPPGGGTTTMPLGAEVVAGRPVLRSLKRASKHKKIRTYPRAFVSETATIGLRGKKAVNSTGTVIVKGSVIAIGGGLVVRMGNINRILQIQQPTLASLLPDLKPN